MRLFWPDIALERQICLEGRWGKKFPKRWQSKRPVLSVALWKIGIGKKLAEDIFELMAEFAKYGFNKSHSAAYGLVSYQTAWLKAHYPEEFLAASMTCDMDHTDKIVRYAEDCLSFGFNILPPDVNRSIGTFDVPCQGQIGFGLAAIKGVGEAVLEPLICERGANGPFVDLSDLARRVPLGKVGKKTLQLITAAGGMDCFGYRRRDLDRMIPALVEFSVELHEASSAGQRSLFSMGSGGDQAEAEVGGAPWQGALEPARRAWDMDDLFAEKKLLGFFLSAHPFDCYRADALSFGGSVKTLKSKVLSGVVSGEKSSARGGSRVGIVALLSGISYRRTKKGSLMAYIRLEERGVAIEGMMFAKQLEGTILPREDSPVAAWGQAEVAEGGQLRFSIESLRSLDELRQERVRALSLEIQPSAVAGGCEEEFARKLKLLFDKSPGPCPLRVAVGFDGARGILSGTDIRVELSSSFLKDIDALTTSSHRIHYSLH